MKFIDDWRGKAHKLWSVRLALLSAALSALEFAVPYLAPNATSGRFAAIAVVVSLSAAVARIIAQPALHNE